MAQDCNLVLLSGTNKTIYSSGTGGEGTACTLTVSSLGGGLISVSRSSSTALYLQPNSFQILFEGQDSATFHEVNQVYDTVTGAVFQAASLPPQTLSYARTLLPTTNAILSFGYSTDCYLYTVASGSWSQTGSLALARDGAGIVTLQDGTALAVSGVTANGLTFTCEVYSPLTGTWTASGSVNVPRGNVATSLLQTGQVSSKATHFLSQ